MTDQEVQKSDQKMNTGKLKKFAQAARLQLLEQVGNRLKLVLQDGSLARRESTKAVKTLEELIKSTSQKQVIERVAYTWFNRFCALRFMDANRYTKIGTVSPAEGFLQPEILMDAKQGHIDEDLKVDRDKVFGLLDGTQPSDDPQQEAYKLLLVASCNAYHSLMPFMFEEIADYTELLIPDDLLSDSSILTYTRQALYPEACQDVEVIGWLYQFYISEKKDDVFAALKKGKKITPENIPAATQLFTPHWIVRYLVENSLGRLWMLNHPDSRLAQQMDYYIRPEEPETDFLRISSPEEIKICDPACGSGHMLTYAFDLLYAIYEEQGYQATDIPRLILTHNLYGIEIDQRAGALAAFALTMKAREKYRRFLTGSKVVQPNICVLENVKIDPEDLSAYMDKVGRDLFTDGLQGVVNQWEEADNFGSLIRPRVEDVSEVLELLRERQMGEDLFLAGVHQKVLKALRQADYLSPKYHVVVGNPPYMGGNTINPQIKELGIRYYADSKSDLFAMFIERGLELVLRQGYLSMVTMQSWMFLSSYESLRNSLLAKTTISTMAHFGSRAFDSIGGDVVSTTGFVLVNSQLASMPGVYFRLVEGSSEAEKSMQLREAIQSDNHSLRFLTLQGAFADMPGNVIAYWASEGVFNAFSHHEPLEAFGLVRQGATTSDNNRFLRMWYEIEFEKIGFRLESLDQANKTEFKWFPYNKGGPHRRWFGNHEYVINYESDGAELKAYQSTLNQGWTVRLKSREYYFVPSVSWPKISSGTFSARYYPAGFIFDVAGCCYFPDQRGTEKEIIAFLNSKVGAKLVTFLSPTVNFEIEQIKKLPYIQPSDVDKCLEDLFTASKADWDSVETSWDYDCSLLLNSKESCGIVSDVYKALRSSFAQTTRRIHELEEENNRRFIKLYGMESDLAPSISRDEVTLFSNPDFRYDSNKSESELEALLLADTMREFISYAVGCMLGRYSLDQPGLILANQGETADDYRQQIPEPTFAPDEDNVIPLLDGDWFTDDISERFKEFLKVTFGTEHYEENLTFLENALHPDNLSGKKRKTIRDYFLKEFYNHHIKLYKKRPIYWLFSSPKGTFNALIYMHRYRPDTVSVVLNDYLREFMTKLTSRMEHLQRVADSAEGSKTEKAQSLKEIAKLKKDLKELEEYEREILYPLATERVEIDLDDGVKVNYNKFGKALKKVTGLTGKA